MNPDCRSGNSHNKPVTQILGGHVANILDVTAKDRVVFLCVVLFCGAIFWFQTVKNGNSLVSRVATVWVHMFSSTTFFM